MLTKCWLSPGQVAQLVRALSYYAKVMGLIRSQGTYESQPMNAQMGGTTNRCFSLSLPLPLSKNQLKKKKNPI